MSPRDRFQKQPAGVLGVEIVEVRHDRHVEARLHEQGGGERFFQRPLDRVLALGLRQHDGQTICSWLRGGLFVESSVVAS